MSVTPLRVLLVDDHEPLRAGLRAMMEDHDDLLVVGEACSGEAAVEEASRLRPDVVVMDLRLPGMNGIEATRHITAQNPAARILVVTMDAPEDVLLEVIEAGGSGYLRKTTPAARVIDAVRAVGAGMVVADAGLVEALKRKRMQAITS
jgi:two-component system response regulator NreC